MNQVIALALLCFSVVRADWITATQYGLSFDCSGTASVQIAYILNTCIVEGSTSTYYQYNPAVTGSFTTVNYQTKDCTGTNSSTTTTIGQCSYGIQYAYSAGLPQLSGLGSGDSTSCGGAPQTNFNVIPYGTCLPIDTTSSTKYQYFGGSRCVSLTYSGVNCTGQPTSAYALPYTCDDTTSASNGCIVNGKFLTGTPIGPTYAANSQVVVTKYYPTTTTCSGPVLYTSYNRIASCSGSGSKTSIVGNKVQVQYYDNFNCTGTNFFTETQDDGVTLGTCDGDADSGDSTISSLGSFPSSTNSPTVILQDKCTGTPTIYNAYVSTPGCVQQNSTHSGLATCSVLGNGTVQFTGQLFANTACSGTAVETDVELAPACEANENDNGATAIRYACSVTFPSPSSSSDASTIVAFSVVIMSVVVALLM